MAEAQETNRGLAVLVGAGPGDPSLITLAGAAWLRRAQCVIYDRLANPVLLDYAPADAERIYVGKRTDQHEMTQEGINRLLVEKCLQGKLVVRLKGGDPFIFGRGGEEIDALREAGVEFRVVPGVTAGVAAGAYAGIPLSDRRAAQTIAFVTGHEDPAKEASGIDWAALSRLDTLVFYMGVSQLPFIARQLTAGGLAGDTPVAVVHRATTPGQRTVTGTLATIADDVRHADLKPPAIIIVGQVAAMRDRMAWYDHLPLFGQTIIVTRARAQASALSAALDELGAAVIEAPTIDIQPGDSAVIDTALGRLGQFDWLVLTSPNGAAAICERMKACGMDGRSLANVKIAAVGPGTAEAMNMRFIHADLLPQEFTTEGLAKAMTAGGAMAGKRVLLARADIATEQLPRMLIAGGASVEELTAYRTVRPSGLPQAAIDALTSGAANWVTFTSSSTVENFLALLDGPGSPGRACLAGVKLAAIGPVTAQTLRSAGLPPTVTAEPHTIDALVGAILRQCGQGRTQ